jgi:hypothetical protein
MERIELRAEMGHELARAGLSRYLAAHLALERASALRSFAVHVAALLGVPAVLCVALSASLRAREVTLGLFSLELCIAGATLVAELRCRRALRHPERGVRIERREPTT